MNLHEIFGPHDDMAQRAQAALDRGFGKGRYEVRVLANPTDKEPLELRDTRHDRAWRPWKKTDVDYWLGRYPE